MSRPSKAPKKTTPAVRAPRAAAKSAPKPSPAKKTPAPLDAWLGEIGRSSDGKAIRQAVAASTATRAVLSAIAEASPYLWDLIRADPARCLQLLGTDPEERLAALLADVARTGEE